MHMSDGLINAPTSVIFGGVAVAGIAAALVGARRDLDDRTAPMAGLVAAFVFATQMINFPILPGVSGHLLGGALAAILVGPWVGALCVSIVLVVQALVFADGGLTALGANITNMALIGTAAGFLVALALRRIATRGRVGLAAAAFVAAFVRHGDRVARVRARVRDRRRRGVLARRGRRHDVGLHALIGIGEGVITALTVTAVAAARPDLVYLLRGTAKPLELRDSPMGRAS